LRLLRYSAALPNWKGPELRTRRVVSGFMRAMAKIELRLATVPGIIGMARGKLGCRARC
jgi:hypothetical protein